MSKPIVRSTLACLAAVSLLAGCGKDSPEQLVASARDYLAKQDTRSAIVELKSALQQNADSPEARYLLGKALLASGEPVTASVELRKALALELPEERVAPELAQALLMQGRHEEVITQYRTTKLSDPAAAADLRTTVALALARAGDAAGAEHAFKQALDAVPGYVRAQVGLARQSFGRGDTDHALGIVDAIIATGAADPATWLLKGDVLAITHDTPGALQAYRKALALQADYLPAHRGIVRLHFAGDDIDAAAAQVAALKKILPTHPQTRFLEAHVALAQKDYKTARELANQLLRLAPDDRDVLELAGTAELHGGSLIRAEDHLQKVVQMAPDRRLARIQLAQIHGRAGDPAKAIDVLEPLLDGSAPDAAALALAGEMYVQTGDLEQAQAMFTRANQLKPDDPKMRIALAITRVLQGDATGMAELREVAASDSGTAADMALVSIHLRRKEYEDATKAIEGLERKDPGKPVAPYLRGVAQAALKQPQAARQSFEKAVERDAGFFPAAASLAALDLRDKKPQAAQQRFDAVLKARPGDLRALLALAELRARAGGDAQEVAALLAQAIRSNPTEAAPRLRLIGHYLQAEQTKQALAAAQEAEAALPGNAAILDALGRAQLAFADINQAGITFTKLAKLDPGSPLGPLRMAQVELARKDNAAAQRALERALAIQPDLVAAQQGLFSLHMAAARHNDALKVARTLQQQRPKHSIGFVFEGDVLKARKDAAGAIAAYRSALTKDDPTQAAIRLHGLLLAVDRRADARTLASTWANDHPGDVLFAFYVGNIALLAADYATAETNLLRVVQARPNDAVALNNLAWAMAKAHKAGAVAYAEKANALLPGEAPIMETLAVALAAEHKIDRALDVQKKAVALAPDNDSLRLTLARLYLQSGQKAAAHTELDRLSKLGNAFRDQAEVSKLLAPL